MNNEEKSGVGAGTMIPAEMSSGFLANERILLPEDAVSWCFIMELLALFPKFLLYWFGIPYIIFIPLLLIALKRNELFTTILLLYIIVFLLGK